eukprot:6380212-Prymnesium_polylepis.1
MRSSWQQRLSDTASVAVGAVLGRSWDAVVDAEIVRVQADARYVAAEVLVAQMQALDASLADERGDGDAAKGQGKRGGANEASAKEAKVARVVALRQEALAEMVKGIELGLALKD